MSVKVDILYRFKGFDFDVYFYVFVGVIVLFGFFGVGKIIII